MSLFGCTNVAAYHIQHHHISYLSSYTHHRHGCVCNDIWRCIFAGLSADAIHQIISDAYFRAEPSSGSKWWAPHAHWKALYSMKQNSHIPFPCGFCIWHFFGTQFHFIYAVCTHHCIWNHMCTVSTTSSHRCTWYMHQVCNHIFSIYTMQLCMHIHPHLRQIFSMGNVFYHTNVLYVHHVVCAPYRKCILVHHFFLIGIMDNHARTENICHRGNMFNPTRH